MKDFIFQIEKDQNYRLKKEEIITGHIIMNSQNIKDKDPNSLQRRKKVHI